MNRIMVSELIEQDGKVGGAIEQGKMKVNKESIPEKWWPDLTEPYENRYPRAFPNE